MGFCFLDCLLKGDIPIIYTHITNQYDNWQEAMPILVKVATLSNLKKGNKFWKMDG